MVIARGPSFDRAPCTYIQGYTGCTERTMLLCSNITNTVLLRQTLYLRLGYIKQSITKLLFQSYLTCTNYKTGIKIVMKINQFHFLDCESLQARTIQQQEGVLCLT